MSCKRILWSAGHVVLLLVFFGAVAPPAYSVDFVVDTNSLTIRRDGALWGQLHSTSVVGGVARFTIGGDLILGSSDTLRGVGDRPASLLIGNDLIVHSSATIDFSAINQVAGAGGGGGGFGGMGGLGGDGGTGGEAGGIQWIRGGGAFMFFFGAAPPPIPAFRGHAGDDGLAGEAGQRGFDGIAGGRGFGNVAPAAAGGIGRYSDIVPFNFGSGGHGGDTSPYWPSPLPGADKNGGHGGDGLEGTDGGTGLVGGAGQGAGFQINPADPFALVAGNGGGGGAGGQGGDGGGGGGGGGGGASGQGNWATVIFPPLPPTFIPGWNFAGFGGSGGPGSDGSDGGRGGVGGSGGWGGGGGGAAEFLVQGIVDLDGSALATGGDGQAGASGLTGGFTGPQSDYPLAANIAAIIPIPGVQTYPFGIVGPGIFPSGVGGLGGYGAAGGQGGIGAQGGQGGGGSGGTLRFVGTTVQGAGSIGVGGGGGINPGADGQLLVGTNTVAPGSSAIGAFGGATLDGNDTTTQIGTRVANPLIAGSPDVPTVAGLIGGAEAFGFTGLNANDITLPDMSTLIDATPQEAFAGLARFDLGPGDLDDPYLGYDMLLFFEAKGTQVGNPLLGIGEENYFVPLLEGGWGNDIRFGGSGDSVVTTMNGFDVYVTLVPEDAEWFNLSVDSGGVILSHTQQFLAPGDVMFVTSSPDVPVLDATWTGTSGAWSDATNWSMVFSATGLPPVGSEDPAVPGVPSNSAAYAYNIHIDQDVMVDADITVAVDQLNIGVGDQVTVASGQALTIERFAVRTDSGKVNNDGVILLDGGAGGTARLFSSGPGLMLDGTGVLRTTPSSNNVIAGLRNGDSLTQFADHAIEAAGALGNDRLVFINHGRVTSLGTLVVDPSGNLERSSAAVTNHGVMEVANSRTLSLVDGFFHNAATGLIEARDTATLQLIDTRIHNEGTIRLGPNSALEITGMAMLTGNDIEFAYSSQIDITDAMLVNQTHLAASIFIGSSIVNNDGGMIGGFDSTEFDWFDIGIGNSTIVGGELDGYVYASNTTFKNVAFLPDMQFDGDNIGLAGVVNNQMGIGQGALGDAQGYGYFYGNATIVEDTTLVGGGFANVEFDHIRGNSVTNTTLTVTPGVSLFVGSLQSAGADFRVVNDGMIEELGVDDVFIVTLTELTNRGNIRGSALYMYDTVVDNSGGLIEALDIELENVAITGGELRGSLVVYEQVDLTGTRLSSFGAPGLDISLESSGDLYLQDIQLASNTTFFGYAPGSNSVTFRSGVEVDSEGILGLSFLDFNIEEDLTFDGTGSLLLEEVLVAGTGGLGQQLTIGPQFTVNSMASFGEYSNLGSSSLRIDNQGTIDALELIIDPIGGFDSVAPGLVNTGIIRGDVYIIDGAIDNEGGTIENAYLAGVSVKGGTLRNVTFDPDAYSDGGYDSNARLEDVALEGFTYVAGGVDLALAGEIVNNGDFEFGDYASIQVDGEVRLSGTGTMIFYDQLEFSTTGTGGTVTNEAGHTLLFESPSQLASFGEVEFTNNGTVSFFEAFLTPTFNSQLLPAGSEVPDLSDPENPDAVTTLTEDTLYEVVRPWTNNGLFQAELLVIENGSVFRNAGLLNASAIDLNDATILNDEGSIQGAAIYLNGASYLTGGSAPGVDIEIESDPGSSPAGIASIDLNDAVVNAYSPVEFGGEVGKIFELSISNFESVPTVLVENADTTVTVETTYIDGGTIRLGAGRFQTDYLEPSTVGPVLDWTGGEFALLLEPVALGATADFGTQLDVPDGGTLVAPLGVTIAAGAALNIGGDVQAPTIASDGLLTVGLDNASGSLASEISGTGALHKTGTGTYALLGNNSYTGLTLLQGGWLEVEADENLGDPTSSLQFAGGNLRVAGPTTGASPRNVTFSTTSASIDLADAGAIFEINSATATAAELNLTKSGPGTLNIRSAINLNRGRLVVAGGELNFFGNLVQLPGVSQPHAANGVNGQSGLSAGDIAISGGTLTGATITANGGNGGDGGNGTGSSSTSVNGRFGGAGARGGNILIVAGELIANRPITLRGGTGGDGGDGINAFVFSGNGGGGGRGGDGGSIILSGGELVMQSSINLSAGIGGFGGNGAFTAPDGPNGSAGILGTLRVQGGTLTTSAGLLDSGLNGNLSFTSGAIRFTDEVFGLGGSARLNAVLGATSKVLTPNKTLRFDNTLAMTAGQSLVINGGSLIAGTIDNSLGGNLAFLSGRLQTGDYQGDLTQQGGTFAPGASPAEVELAGDYLQSGGVLEIEIGGTNPGEFDALTVTGDVTLAGELQTILLGDFVPTLGQSWQVLTVDGMLNGEFADLPEASLFGTYGNYQLQVTYAGGDGNDVVLTTAPLLAGDLNADGRVDAADYTVWRDNLGSAGQASFTFGDSDGDGDTDHDDYAIWRQNFGASVAALSDANVSVPEPAALAIAGLAILCLRLVRSSWQNNQSEIDESIV